MQEVDGGAFSGGSCWTELCDGQAGSALLFCSFTTAQLVGTTHLRSTVGGGALLWPAGGQAN
jgi:hypothetical protein